MSGSVSSEFILRRMDDMQSEFRQMRRELADIRTLTISQIDQGRRFERRLSELKDEIELIVKVEVMGRIGIFEGGVEKTLGELTDRVEELETGKSRFTP